MYGSASADPYVVAGLCTLSVLCGRMFVAVQKPLTQEA
jgi:hypothetical protein